MNILLIENDPGDRALIEGELRQSLPDAGLIDSRDADSVRDRIAAGDVTVVLLGTPPAGLSAGEILQNVRSRQAGCPVLGVARHGGAEAAVAAMRAGMDDYVATAGEGLRRLGPAIREAVERIRGQAAEPGAGESDASGSDDRVRHWLQITPASLCQCTADGRFVEANASFRAMLAIDAATDLGRACLQDYLAAPGRPGVPGGLEAVVAAAQQEAGTEVAFRRTDGAERWVLMRANVRRMNGGPDHLECAFTDVTDRKREAERISGLLREKNVLIEELYHRVNNNLQIVMSFVHQLIRETVDASAKANLKDLSARIQSLSLVQDQLYRNQNFAEADFRQYLEELCAARLRGSRIALSLELTELRLPVAQAIPIGLIANELLVNAVEHAFGGVAEPAVTVMLRRTGPDRVVLTVRDNGVGFTAVPQPHRGGYGLIDLLARQIGAEMEVAGPPGTSVQVVFPVLG